MSSAHQPHPWRRESRGSLPKVRVPSADKTGIDLRAINRRIGERVPIRLDQIDWQPPAARRLLRGAPKPQQAQVIDLSVTGARVLAPDAPPLALGTRVNIRVRGHGGVVEIRRSEPSGTPGLVAYGVQFVALDAGLTALVTEVLGSRRPDVDWRWDAQR